MDSWTVHLYGMMKAGDEVISVLFFSFLIVGGNFFMLNLVLAVIIHAF